MELIKTIILAAILGLFIFAINKPTSKTVYTQPVQQISTHNYENLKVSFGGCARFPEQK